LGLRRLFFFASAIAAGAEEVPLPATVEQVGKIREYMQRPLICRSMAYPKHTLLIQIKNPLAYVRTKGFNGFL
jgi:hypothetical protein